MKEKMMGMGTDIEMKQKERAINMEVTMVMDMVKRMTTHSERESMESSRSGQKVRGLTLMVLKCSLMQLQLFKD